MTTCSACLQPIPERSPLAYEVGALTGYSCMWCGGGHVGIDCPTRPTWVGGPQAAEEMMPLHNDEEPGRV